MPLTKKQTLTLWALLVKPGGSALEKDIRPLIDNEDRDALIRAGFVSCQRVGRAFALEVTEQGWTWAQTHLGAELPPNAPAASQILQAWLKQIQAFLTARDLNLADIMLARPAAPPQADVQIRAAYLVCTKGAFNRRVSLAEIRPRLAALSRARQDEALRNMHLSGEAHLSSSDNPPELDAPERDAALDFKGETKYAIWIER